MVLLKQENYGVNGYQLPVTPRGARSSRKRCSFKNRVDNRICAFDLLASVARKLLHENGSISTSSKRSDNENCDVSVKATLKRERQDESQSLKVETCDQGSCKRQVVDSELPSQDINRNDNVPQPPSFGNGSGSDCSAGIDDHMDVGGQVKIETGRFLCKVEGCPSFSSGPVHSNKSEDGNKGQVNEDEDMANKFLMVEQVNLCQREEPIVWDEKSNAQISPVSSAKAATCGDHTPHRSVSADQFDDVNVVSRDDDEIILGYACPGTMEKSFRSGPRIGDRRIRKILASKYWKVAPKLSKVSLSSSDEAFKPSYCERSFGLKRLRSERNFPIKKRKSLHYSSVSSSDGGIISDRTSYSPEKDINEDSSPYLKLHGASGATSSVAEKVKLRIKSFKVPELFVEIPETATVGSLKRTVVEALSSILGDGLGVGILLQGKKIKDDNKTLLQTGISRGNQLDSLGFSLEPNSFRTLQSSCPAKCSMMLPHEAPQPLNRIPGNPNVIHGKATVASEEQQVPDLINFNERVHDNAFTSDVSSNKHATDSKTLVAVPAISFEALAMVPAHRKPKQAEFAQRRIRRPFSVAEVEALVQAVEKIGTGRWRDVKLRAFDDAKHRTYVDLKDKWKTLVHTARISPQQRRGEPVPQELLDRVLRAQAHWSEQQAKQRLKQQPETGLGF